MAKQKILFIDRDGTLINEPPVNFQVDSFAKLSFLPGLFKYLGKIASELDYKFAMVTNQDGLGTPSFPEDTFWPVQNFIVDALKAEGIEFYNIHIDKTFEADNKPTRKPNLGMLQEYLNGEFDLENSFVIGDRMTDFNLSKNLGAKSILIKTALHEFDSKDTQDAKMVNTWEEIYNYLKLPPRIVTHQRNTSETQIDLYLDLDGKGRVYINTGLNFFNHMLEQIGKHSGVDLKIKVNGDLHIDEHHTIEDTAIALGEAFYNAIGNKAGIERYAFVLPMDDCLATVAIDFGGRSWLVWDAEFKRERIGDVPTEMFYHFFKSFSDAAKCNLNIKVDGDNEHHKIESIFKALAKCIKQAVKRDINNMVIPSTKGTL